MTTHDFKSLDEIPFGSHRFYGDFTKRELTDNVKNCYKNFLFSCLGYKEQEIDEQQLWDKCYDRFGIPFLYLGDGIVKNVYANFFGIERLVYNGERQIDETEFEWFRDIFATRKEQVDAYIRYVENEFEMFQTYYNEYYSDWNNQQKKEEVAFLNEVVESLKKKFLTQYKHKQLESTYIVWRSIDGLLIK